MASYTKLYLGSRGDAVRRLQTRLNANGAHLAVDGVFGKLTDAAVRRYQQDKGLAVDGVVGDATWGSLLAAPAAAGSPAPAAISAPPAAGQTAHAPAPAAPGVSAATAAALAAYQGDYTPSEAVRQAEEALRRAAQGRPGDYSSPYAADMEALLARLRSRPAFSYDLRADPLYRQYLEQYTRRGRLAMEDTQGRAAALTGGYGSTYAQGAGQQAYDRYLQELNGKVPALYELARSRYDEESRSLRGAYDALSDAEQAAYSRWRDAMGDWERQVKAGQSLYDRTREADYKAWQDQRDYWQRRADAEGDAWWQQRQWADRQALEREKLALRQRSAASGGKSGRSGGKSAGQREILVHIPGYGTIPMEEALELERGSRLYWVMKDDRKTHMTDEAGNYLARLRKVSPRTAVHTVN